MNSKLYPLSQNYDFFFFFLIALSSFLDLWLPWTNFLSEVSIIQALTLVNIFFFFNSKNAFYSCVYFFLSILNLGVFLAFFNFEFLTGFFWVVEFTVFFIFLVFYFYFSSNGTIFFNKNFYLFFYLFFFFFFVFFSSIWAFSAFEKANLNFSFLWDDFYDALNLNIMNDLNSFFLNFFIFNSFFFFLFTLLIFFTTILCINLYLGSKKNSLGSVASFLKIFNFFKDFSSFSFMRKQNLVSQNLRKPVNRLVSKEQFVPKFYKKKEEEEEGEKK